MRQIVEVVTSGGAGTSTGSGKTAMSVGNAIIREIDIDYSTSPVTTDVTITDSNGKTIFSLADANTDGTFALQQAGYDASDGSATSAYVDGVMAQGYINVAVAQSNDAVTLTFIIDYEPTY